AVEASLNFSYSVREGAINITLTDTSYVASDYHSTARLFYSLDYNTNSSGVYDSTNDKITIDLYDNNGNTTNREFVKA
nr:hypothetical protein [Bacilli bacterium]